MISKFEHALNRVKNIPKQFFEGEKDVNLYWEEFVRRFYDFADQMPSELKDYDFDMEEILGQILSDETHQLIDEAIALSEKNTSYIEQIILKQYLILTALACENNELALKNTELFEPAIRIMESGSIIRFNSRNMLIGAYTYASRGICNRKWAAQEPVDIDAIPLKKQNGERAPFDEIEQSKK